MGSAGNEVLDRSTVEEQAAMPGPSSSETVTDGLAAGQECLGG